VHVGSAVLALVVVSVALPVPAAHAAGWSVVARAPRGSVEVAIAGPRDIWAVGGGVHHWNGKRWKDVAVPGAEGLSFKRVVASSPRDVWLASKSVGEQHLAHWDGSSWSVLSYRGTIHKNSDVVAINGDLWATGVNYDRISAGLDRTRGTRILSTRAPRIWVHALAASARDDVWAVGNKLAGPDGAVAGAGIDHWDGSRWRTVRLPKLGMGRLEAVAAASRSNAWAFGGQALRLNRGVTLALHWNGRSWRVLPSPGDYPDVLAAAPDGKGGVWASTGTRQLHYAAGRWTIRTAPHRVIALRRLPGTKTVWGVQRSTTLTVIRFPR
jgi:hypothetical protein